MATLTYVYADQTAVLGPLATFAEPHTYDLCAEHAERLTAPRGWDVVRLVTHFEDAGDADDDLLAVADALRDRSVREQATRRAQPEPVQDLAPAVGERRGHLRVLREGNAHPGDR